MKYATQRPYALWLTTVWLLAGGFSWSSLAWATPPDDWEVLRIFIPDDRDQISRLVTPAYTPVLLDELARDLAEENSLRKKSLLEAPMLEEAIYVARLEAESITSDQSRWILTGRSASQPYVIGNVSIGLRPARGISPDKPQLVDHAQFTPSGSMELLLPGGEVERWFGFTANSINTASLRTFNFRLPPAPTAKLLLATPAAAELSSESVVVEKIQSPTTHVPGDWNVSGLTTTGPASQWWLINLSGVEQFDLSIAQQATSSLTWYKHLIKESSVDYAALPNAMLAHAKFVVAGLQENQPLRVRASAPLRIKDVLLDGKPIAWRVQPSLAGDSNLIELLSLPAASDEVTLEIDATCVVDTSLPLVVPELGIAESYTLSGVTRLYGADGLVVDDLSASGCLIQRLPAPSGLTPADLPQAEQLVWQAEWLGNAPRLEASFSQERRAWVARSLTRFTIQSDWLSAHCRIHIDSRFVDSNELRLRVGRNWFIDNVKLVQTATDIRARLEDREDAENPFVVVNWEGQRENISLELDVVAHSPRDTSAEFISLRSPRLITLPGADQLDNYVIEPSTRFNVQLNSSLLRYQLQPVDLPDWQQQLLPQLTDKWIFQGTRGTIPPITLEASGGTFSSSVATVVSELEEKLSVATTVQCRPISGSIDRLAIILPAGFGDRNLAWHLVQDGAESPVPLVVSGETNGGLNHERLIELELPAPLGSAFTVQTEMPLEIGKQGTFPVPVMSTPAATSGESLLILPRRLAEPVEQTSIELLPATLCCSDDQLMQFVDDLDPSEQSSLVAARMENGVSQTIVLRQRQRAEAAGWVWSELLQHRLFEDGRVSHEVHWVVEGTAAQSLEAVLPKGWQVEAATLDSQPIDVEVAGDERIVFDLPGYERSTLRLHCTSQRSRAGWCRFEPLERPRLAMPVLQRKEVIWVPPARMPLQDITAAQRPLRLADRLVPSSWWRLLAPAGPGAPDPQLAATANWTMVDVRQMEPALSYDFARSERTPAAAGIWLIHRTAFSALILASVLALAAIFWWFLGTSPRLWWLMLSIAAVSVVLVPAIWVAPAQLVLLALACAATLRLFAVVGRLRSNSSRSRGNSGIVSQLSLPHTTAVWLCCLAAATPALGQTTGTSSSTDAAGMEANPQVFGVLIPVDEAGEVSGAYAYVPTRLLELLSGPDNSLARSAQPRILSADYTLRTRRSAVDEQDQVQELSVEFRIQVPQADSEIRLPVKLDQLLLLRGSAGGQELFVGGRSLYQVSDAIVFRSSMPGTVRLQLQFEPRELVQDEGAVRLACNIPPIPNATLRIVADAPAMFEIDSIDGQPKMVTSSITELLGPVEELNVRWSHNVVRSTTGQPPAEVFADTWVHAQATQVMALCQMRIFEPRGLPRDLHVIAEPGWEPVGVRWGDVELIANELSSLGGRRLYTVRGPENWTELSQLTIQVLMVPRSSEGVSTMTLPFFSLQEVSQQSVTRTLAWSKQAEAAWRPDGLEFWQEVTEQDDAESSIDWGALRLLETQPQLFRVPLSSMATTLRRLSPAMPNAVDEITQVHLGAGEARIQYRAQCQAPDKRAIAIVIPRGARVDAVLLDGNIPRYRVSEHQGQSLVEILPGDDPVAYEVVEIELSQPVNLSRKTELPRVLLRGFEATSSIYRLLRGAGLLCDVEATSDLQLETVSTRPTELLSNLESLVGQVDLRDEYRDQATLPLSFTLRRRPAFPSVNAVLYIDRAEQGWKARVTAQWESGEEPLDFVFFELPVNIRESVKTGQLPARFIPMGDSGRMTLCMIPSPPVSGKTFVEFEFTLPAVASSQSVAIPQVGVLATAPIRPTLALPATIDAKPVRWIRTGRRLDPNWQNPLQAAGDQQYQFFELEKSQSQVNWKPLENAPRRAEVLASQVKLLAYDGQQVAGFINYWVQPGGQLSLPLEVPAACNILGVEIGGRPAIWHTQGDKLSVLLQPNYLPVNIRLLLRWQATNPATMQLAMPRVTLDGQATEAQTSVDNWLEGWRLEPIGDPARAWSGRQEQVNGWAEMLVASLPLVGGQSPQEMETWLAHWHPHNVNFDGTETVSSPVVQTAFASYGVDDGETDTATTQAVWNLMRHQVGLPQQTATPLELLPMQTLGAELGLSAGSPASARQSVLIPNPGELQLVAMTPPSGFVPRSTAAGLMAAAALLMLVLARRVQVGYGRLLSAQPWLYWVQLALIAWLLLPVAWPSWIILATAAGMLLSQFIESRRRTRLLARV